MLGTCLLFAGGSACAGGGAPLGQVVGLLIGALVAAGLGGFMMSGCRGQGAPVAGDSRTDIGALDGGGVDAPSADAPPTPFACGTGSLPPGAPGTTGWSRCCLGGQIRVCPPPPPTTACNYGWNETYCPDGLTCGLSWTDPCGAGNTDAAGPDASTDAVTDTAPSQDAATDPAADVFLGCGAGSRPADGGVPDGWIRCCLASEIRWCPPPPQTVACNYGMAQFCPDGITCGSHFQNPCGVIDGGSTEVMP